MKWYDHEVDPHNRDPRKQKPVEMGAEYRFAPLVEHIQPAPLRLPGPADAADLRPVLSHSRPVPGGLTGRIWLHLRATTPVLFGKQEDDQTRPGRDGKSAKNTVPATLHDGADADFILPGAASRGMIRSIYRIITMSALKPVNMNHQFVGRTPEYRSEVLRQPNGHQSDGNQAGGERFWRMANEVVPGRGWLVPVETNENEVRWEVASTAEPATTRAMALPLAGQSVRVVDLCDASGFPFSLSTRLAGKQGSAFAKVFGRGARFDPENPEHRLWLRERDKCEAWNSKDHKLTDRIQYLISCGIIGDTGIEPTRPDALAIRDQLKGRYLVLSGEMASKTSEAWFDMNIEHASRTAIGSEDMRRFLAGNSAYSKQGAPFLKGKRRKLTDELALALAEYLHGLPQDGTREALERTFGVKGSDASRREKPPGIPVYFFHNSVGGISIFGLAQMMRIPFGHTVGEVRERMPAWEASRDTDWTEALFGSVDAMASEDEEEAQAVLAKPGGIGGRVFFANAIARTAQGGRPTPLGLHVVSQQAPKASFDCLYLSWKNEKAEKGGAKWDDDDAVLAGHKRYPACRPLVDSLTKPYPGCPPADMDSVVSPLPEGTSFDLAIDFHNLHPLELGGLLWAVCLGERAVMGGKATSMRHVGGRMRNAGWGRLAPEGFSLSLTQNPMPAELALDCQDPGASAIALMTAFEAEIGARLSGPAAARDASARAAFWGSEPIRALLNMADAEYGNAQDRDAWFKKPPPKSNGDTDFSHFQNLRYALYKKMGVYGEESPRRTVVNEFLEERSLPEPDAEILPHLVDPAGLLRQRLEKAG